MVIMFSTSFAKYDDNRNDAEQDCGSIKDTMPTRLPGCWGSTGVLMDISKDRGDVRQQAIVILSKRPVDQRGASNNIATRHEAPEA